MHAPAAFSETGYSFDKILKAVDYFNNNKIKNVYAGILYRDGFSRNNDAVIPVIGFTYNQFDVGFSYDVNISDFGRAANTNATNNFGGPEFSLIYILRKVNEEEFCPTCPVYQ